MSSQQNIECPICYDDIDVKKNCITTECGHIFHCKCLLQNAATNGFACPMCRSTMATEPELSDDEDDYEEYSDDEDEEGEALEPFDFNALTSFRMFHQQLAGEEVEEEQELIVEEPLVASQPVEEAEVKPNAAYIAAKLVNQGFTMEDMVKCLLVEHEEYEPDIETNDSCSNRMFGKFRQIISTYKREQQQQQQQQQEERQQSSRLRARDQVEDLFGQLQNRYELLNNDSDLEDV
jgi:hypothetical protein